MASALRSGQGKKPQRRKAQDDHKDLHDEQGHTWFRRDDRTWAFVHGWYRDWVGDWVCKCGARFKGQVPVSKEHPDGMQD